MAQRISGYERKPRDLYETPEWVTRALISYIHPIFDTLNVWEPACASGKMARELGAIYASDLVTTYGTPGVDFLKTDRLPERVNAIITNPPFNREAEKFIRHGIELIRPIGGFMAMLLPIDFDSGKTRRDMFGACPGFAAKLVLTSRIVWFDPPPGAKNKGPSQNHAWFIWDYADTGQLGPAIAYDYQG